MVGYYNQGVPTSADLENNSNQKKYTVNQTSNKGVTVSKPLCVLMAIGALLLAVLVGLVVFFTIPRQCNGEKHPEALTKSQLQVSNSNKNNYNNSSDKVNDKADNKNNQIIVEDLTDERLPRSIEPTHYRIRILPDLENFTISGSVTMLLKVNEETNDIIFHINDIEIVDHSVTVKPKNTSSPLKISTQEYLPGFKYSISLKHKLKKDTEYELYLDYNGKLNKQLQGFYGSHYDKKIIASTQFSPTDARRAFPCFDEPSFKAKFTIVLGRPQDMNTLSNMPLFNSTPFSINSETWYWDEYPETPKMSTYLVAFIISDLKQAPVTDSLMKFWSRDKYVSQTAFAAEIGPKILRYYEDYFGTKFPLEKIDIVALPAFGFGAMENWGLITFRESSLLYDPESSTNDDKRTIATVLAHEIAHQWFGNLVTPKFWNDLWLKEGFADYMQYLGINQIEPKWKFLEEFVPFESRRAMDADAFQSARPISLDEVKNSHEIRQLFDAISYSKGAAVIRMINFFLGDETFKKGLSNFLKKHQYSNADRQDLFRALTEEAHNNNVLNPDENVKTIMDSWVEKAGFPVVNAEVDYEQQKLTINQKRFYFLQKDEKSSWWVPISFTSNATDSNPNFTDTTPKYWLKSQYEIQVDTNVTEGDWFLLNLQQTGYYIVNYNEQNWNTLSENIMEFPPSIRAQLISDSMDLARANLLKYDIPLYMIANMAVQDSAIMYIPTLTALSKMKYLSDILSTTPAFGLFEEYHKNIFQETYRKVILADTVDDYISRRIGTTVLNWSCRSPESRCTHMAKTQFREWIVSGKRVAHNLRNIVYCTAIREGGEIEWDFAYKQYLEAPSLNEENTILDALGCTKLRWLLSRYVDKILDDPSIRIQDADRIFESVVKNKFGTQIGFDFIRKNWDAIIEYHGQGFNIVSRMVVALGTQMSTEFELSELIRFRDGLKEKNKLGTISRAFEKAIDNVKANVEWMEKNYQQVYHWLQNNRDLRTRIHEKVKLDRYLQETNRHPRRVYY